MVYMLVAILILVICYLSVRLFLLRKSMKEAGIQLREINKNPEENRTVKLSVPDKELEGLLEAVNNSLQGIRMEKVSFMKRETEFKQQIENISHDLRTPLTSMIGYLRIMDASGLSEEEQQDLRTVLRKAERLQELITEFYDFSRLTTKEYSLDVELVDITKSLREALADAYSELSRRQLSVTAKIPEVPVCVMGNASALQRVFQNLLQNAGRYAVSLLEVSVKQEGEWVTICFSNDVEGLSQRDVEMLFLRFYTQDKSRNSGSTGLGLTIAKEFVEKMRGSIEARVDGNVLSILLRFKGKYDN